MSLGGETFATWEKMKQVFLGKHQEYYRTKDKREELFKMVQKDDESLEDFVERLMYNVQRSGHTTIGRDVLKIILLRGIKEDLLDMLNMLRKGHISKEPFNHIVDLCQRYSRGSSRTIIRDRDIFSRAQKSSGGGATWSEIGNLLDNFKTVMMSSISSKLDVMRAKQKHVAEDIVLGVFFPKCRKKHLPRECPLDKVEVCGLCELEHNIKDFPSLPKAKAVFQASTIDTK